MNCARRSFSCPACVSFWWLIRTLTLLQTFYTQVCALVLSVLSKLNLIFFPLNNCNLDNFWVAMLAQGVSYSILDKSPLQLLRSSLILDQNTLNVCSALPFNWSSIHVSTNLPYKKEHCCKIKWPIQCTCSVSHTDLCPCRGPDHRQERRGGGLQGKHYGQTYFTFFSILWWSLFLASQVLCPYVIFFYI